MGKCLVISVLTDFPGYENWQCTITQLDYRSTVQTNIPHSFVTNMNVSTLCNLFEGDKAPRYVQLNKAQTMCQTHTTPHLRSTCFTLTSYMRITIIWCFIRWQSMNAPYWHYQQQSSKNLIVGYYQFCSSLLMLVYCRRLLTLIKSLLRTSLKIHH